MNPSSIRSSTDGSRGHGASAPSMRKSLLFAACIVAAAALAIAITASKPDTFAVLAEPPRAATNAEQRAIMTALIAHRQSQWEPIVDADGKPRPYAVENTTLAICGEARQSREPCEQAGPVSAADFSHFPRSSKRLTDALPHFNAGRRFLDARALPGIVAVDRRQTTVLLAQGFHRAQPQVTGIVRVSWATVSARGDQAMLYVETSAAAMNTRSQREWLTLRRGQWKIVGPVGPLTVQTR